MRILWITNVPLPEASKLLNVTTTHLGGWLIQLAEMISGNPDIVLFIAFPLKKNNMEFKVIGEKVTYYPFKPIPDNKKSTINDSVAIKKILDDVKPDLVHIHGTEYSHSLAAQNICDKNNIETVVSIQGLVSFISGHMTSNLPNKVINSSTIRNILLNDSIKGLIKSFRRKGKNEIATLESTKYVIGRTTWDYACSKIINPNVYYFKCNEVLRESFYNKIWDINRIEKHSIFLSQGNYSIKGLHNMIHAMTIITRQFPSAKLYVSGKDITKTSSFKERFLMTYYGKYIKSLIIKFKLQNNVIFTGPLSEDAICEQYLKSNAFVCPSLIENSPNSLGEAMILGVPCIASFVGGIPDMMEHEVDGIFYQHDAYYMLAHHVIRLFSDQSLAIRLSTNARKRALITHDPSTISLKTQNIYNSIFLRGRKENNARD